MKYLNAKFLNSLAEKRVGEEFLKNNPGTTVIIKPFYGGNRYYMFTQKVYPDVRMVGAPPSSIGKFGADTDNWKWPRHTGDFSIFRVYADSLGNPAPYDTSNVPLRPKNTSTSVSGVSEKTISSCSWDFPAVPTTSTPPSRYKNGKISKIKYA